jgi:hypothetical protein
VVVRIHADWCLACKVTQSTIDYLKRAYAGKINVSRIAAVTLIVIGIATFAYGVSQL